MSRILICDDSPGIVDNATAILRSAGYEVVTADSGVGALCKLAEKPPPDVVLLDLGMPGGGGRDVLAQLGPTSPRIIVMTGADTEGLDLAHVWDVLFKPFPAERLLASVADALSPKAGEGCP